ncbi:MAG: SDR family oxidoreductase [Proteobacteria bacterium]|nr:SDR family oxidoreductase [Pseudomonadota bacterium]
MTTRFAGRVVVVTGAADGIGYGIAAGFLQAGALVHALDINAAGLESAQRRIGAPNERFRTQVVDVSRPEEVTRGTQQILRESPQVDVLVNNAGINMFKRLNELEPGHWDRVMDTNLKSIYMMCKAFWPGFIQQRSGVIINISSIMGQAGGVGAPAYCSSKAGIIMLSRCLAKDGAGYGIRVNSICPGYIDTPIMERQYAEQPDPVAARKQVLDKQPLGRIGTPRDIANGALFLASDEASFISGTELTIDGAVTATQID